MWDHAEGVMSRVLDEIKARHGNVVTTSINPGEGAFYGPKFEYVLRDAIGRDWQCGTTQVDFNLPERFGAFYIAANSEKTTPVMIHRAICGSMERFIGILLEHHAGHLPLWLAPVQIVVCTITSEADDYALEFAARAKKRGLTGRNRPAQREDQLQGARALAGQGPGSPRRRPQGGDREYGVDAAARLERADLAGRDEAIEALGGRGASRPTCGTEFRPSFDSAGGDLATIAGRRAGAALPDGGGGLRRPGTKMP